MFEAVLTILDREEGIYKNSEITFAYTIDGSTIKVTSNNSSVLQTLLVGLISLKDVYLKHFDSDIDGNPEAASFTINAY